MAVNLIDSTDISVSQVGSDIQLNASNDIKNQQVYSTSETRIGTWIDGKPLYRKVISDTLGTTNGSWKEITNIWNSNEIKYVVSSSGMFSYSNGNNYSIPFSRITNDSYSSREYVLLNIIPSTGSISVVAYHPTAYQNMSGRPFYLMVLYTKTSDYS